MKRETDIYALVVPVINDFIAKGKKKITSTEVYGVLRSNDPYIFKNWYGDGRIISYTGIKKSVGDFMGGHTLHFVKIANGVYELPCSQLPVVYQGEGPSDSSSSCS